MKLTLTGIPEDQPGTRTAESPLARFLLPSLQDMLFLALFVAVIVLGPRLLNMDGDLGRHLTLGRYILDNGHIPTNDLFSHTMVGEILTPHEWLAAVIFAGIYRSAGLDGVVVLCALLIAFTFALVYRQCLARSGEVLVSVGFTLLAAAAASLHWLARPHLFTLLLVVLWIELLERVRKGQTTRWWLLAVLMLAWVNLHGGFLAGFALWFIYLLGELYESRFGKVEAGARPRLRLLMMGGAAALVVSLANPAGWRLWETSLGYLGNDYLVGHTVEYFSPNFHLVSTWPFLGMIVLSLLLFGGFSRRIEITHLILVAAWTAMALVSTRNIPLYAVIVAPIMANALHFAREPHGQAGGFFRFQQRLRQVDQGISGHIWPLLGSAILAIAMLKGTALDPPSQRNQFDPQAFPVTAVDWLETQPDLGPVFNYFPWGGYLLYRLWPEQRVFIDGQTDFYGEDLTREYEQVISLQPGWQEVLKRHKVNWVIMPPESGLVRTLESGTDWEVLYEDGTAAVLSIKR